MKKIVYILLASTLSISTQAQIDRSKAPAGGPAKEISIGKSENFVLENGLQVIVVENHKLPQVQASLYFNHPPMAYGDKAGITDIIGNMLMAGTTSMEKEQLDEEIDFMGSSISVSGNAASFSSLKKNAVKTFGLFADIIQNPAFKNEAELEKVKKQLKTAIESTEKNPDAISSRVANVLLYGANHPYGEYVTPEKIDGISMDDLRSYYTRTFIPGNAILTLVGDITLAEAKNLVQTHFKTWKGITLDRNQSHYKAAEKKATRIVLVDLPGSTQSVISILNTTNLKKANADYFNAYVGNAILGTGMASRLFKNIREDKGWTYGAYSSMNDDFYLNGEFMATAKVRNNVTDSAVVEFMSELNKIRKEAASEEEINLNKAQITGIFALGLEKPETVARFARTTKIEGLPADFYNNFLKNINSTTASGIKDAMSKYIDADHATILIVGKAEEILEPLKRLGYPIEFADKYGNPAADPTAKKSAGDITGKQIVDKYLQAIGGAKALKKVKTTNETYTVTISGAPMELQGAVKKMNPNKSDFQITMSGMAIMRRAFDGNTGFSEQMGQRVAFTEDEIKEAKSNKGIFAQMFYTPEMLQVDAIVSINGKDAYKVWLIEGEEKSAQFYEVESGLLLKTEKETKGENDESIMVSTEYSDYKEFSGVKFPGKVSITTGEQTITMVLNTLTLNKGVKASDFF